MCVKGIPKTSPGFDDSLGGLLGRHVVTITARIGYSQSAKKKGGWGKSWGKQSVSFKESFPSGVTQDTQQVVTTCGNATNRGSSFEIQCPGFLLGVGQVDSPLWASPQIPDSQKERRCSAYPVLLVQTV